MSCLAENSGDGLPSEREGCDDEDQVAPPGWCLDLEAIAEGLKAPAFRKGSQKSSAQTENVNPNDGPQRKIDVEKIRKSSSSEDDGQQYQRKIVQIDYGGSSCESNSPKVCQARAKAGGTSEDAASLGLDLNAQDRRSAAFLEHCSGRRVYTKEQSASTSASILTEEDANLPRSKHALDRGSSAEVMKKEYEPWRDSIQTLREEITDIKGQMDNMRSHFTTVLTVIQSQIQQLLRSQKESKPVSPPEVHPGPTAISLDQPRSFTDQTIGLGESLQTGNNSGHSKNLPSITYLGKSMGAPKAPANELPAQSSVSQHGTYYQPNSTGRFDSLPSYAEMRRSEMDTSTGGPISCILQPSERVRLGEYNNTQDPMVNVPTVLVNGQQATMSCGGARPSHQEAQTKSPTPRQGQNVPGPWVNPNTLLPPYSSHVPETKVSSQDLSSSLSLRAHGTSKRHLHSRVPDASW